jgi:glucose/arabinose dehydrogenase
MKTVFSFLFLFASIINIPESSAQVTPSTVNAVRIADVNQAVQVLSASNNPNNNDLLLVGHDGVVHYWNPISGLRSTPFLDLGINGLDIIDFGDHSEQGLNGMTLDPDFADNGLVYVMYNGYRPDGTGELIDERLLCFKTSDDHSVVDTEVWAEVLELVQPDQGHNGGQILYGPEGYLYISTGDGGSTGTGATGGGSNGDDHGPIGNGQSLETLLGKILRIETNGLEPYTIPSSNPFVGVENALDEIWAYGLRNPWRFCFDSENGDMYIGDVGEVDWEEINYEEWGSIGGLNYGWRLMEGSNCYDPIVDCDPDNETEEPIFAYQHENGLCSVIGGVVYRGEDIPSLEGCYVFSDACGFGDTQFFTLKKNNSGGWINQPLEIDVEGGFQPWTETKYAFGTDNKGEIYLCTRFSVYKLLIEDDCAGTFDICGVCNGLGPVYDCGCLDIPEGDCDCFGNQVDAIGICGGGCISDSNNDGVCNSFCQEDLDSDGYITIQDLLLILSEFGCTSSCDNDINQDGYVAVYDLLQVLSEFGNSCE